MVSFAEPLRLSLIALPGLAIFLVLFRHHKRLSQQRSLASPAVWERLMGGAPATGLVRLLLWSIAAAFVVVALARPQWGEIPAIESVQTRDLVVAIDVSDSMLCPDIRPSRLGRSLDIINRVLPAYDGNRVGVVVFAGDAYPLVPLTTDIHAVGSFLDVVEPGMVALPGSNVQRAVDASLKLLPEEGDGRVLILFTDGENLQGDLGAAAEALSTAEVGFLGIVAGTADGGPIPVLGDDGTVHYKRDKNNQPVVTHARREALERVASGVDGEVIELSGSDSLRLLIDGVDRIRTREIDISKTVQLVERFPIFLIAAAVLLIAGFALSPWRKRVLVTVALFVLISGTLSAQSVVPANSGQVPPPAISAAEANGDNRDADSTEISIPWWQRFIPGGSRRLARSGAGSWGDGEVEEAVEKFAGAALLDQENGERLFDLGTALAAGGQAETAIGMLEEAGKQGVAGSSYNAGTALLQGGQAEPAVTWLRKALLENSDDPDVKRNYELALRLLEQQEQEQEQEQQDENSDENEDSDEKEEQQPGEDQQPTPTPTPSPSDGAPSEPSPTPTPDPNNPLYAALEQAESDARDAMSSPTPQAVKVEKDW